MAPFLKSRRMRVYAAATRPDGTVLCYVCGRPVAWEDSTVEHMIPRARGGTDEPSNLAISHAACNSRRGSKIRFSPIPAPVAGLGPQPELPPEWDGDR